MTQSAQAEEWSGKRVLVVYHSRTGHTRTVAKMIQRQTGGDLVEIETVEPYPADYDELVAQNVREQNANFLPPLSTRIDDLAAYDVVFLGSPLWNVRLTPPLRSFVAGHDFSNMKVAPFVTYIVSHLGRLIVTSRRSLRAREFWTGWMFLVKTQRWQLMPSPNGLPPYKTNRNA